MGFKANVDGLKNLYCKIIQVNIRNEHETEILEDGTIKKLPTYPLMVVLFTYTDETKVNKIKIHEHTISYELDGDNPIKQAYDKIKSKYDITEEYV